MRPDGSRRLQDFDTHMTIRVVRVGRRWPKQYQATVTPPEGSWSAKRAVGRQRLNWKRRNITHSTDFWDLVNAADAQYEPRQS
jgi:hypothetical protein